MTYPIAARAALIPLLLILAACGGGASPTPAVTDAPSVAPTEAASAEPSQAAGGATLETMDSADHGTILVAGENGLTLYIFTDDVRDSGESTCTGECLTIWPALTVPDGTEPTAGAGISGTLGTIVRTDDGSTQVTYNGLPLYFFQTDTAPGDVNGVYEKWEVVAP